MALEDLTGKVFGLLTVIEQAKRTTGTRWLCKCECGNFKVFFAANIKRGLSRSCGCLSKKIKAEARTKHGKSKSSEYIAWSNAKGRCNNPNDNRYDHYGARGITFDKAWDDFEVFLADMGPKPSSKHTLERIDVDQGYTASNCKWVHFSEQAHNKQVINKYGVNGVYERCGRYVARIGVNGKDKHIGTFDTVDEAIDARLKAEKEYWHG